MNEHELIIYKRSVFNKWLDDHTNIELHDLLATITIEQLKRDHEFGEDMKSDKIDNGDQEHVHYEPQYTDDFIC